MPFEIKRCFNNNIGASTIEHGQTEWGTQAGAVVVMVFLSQTYSFGQVIPLRAELLHRNCREFGAGNWSRRQR
jgi:hypothetical protein